MKNRMIGALIRHAEANLVKHRLNVEVFLDNPTGVAEHTDYLETIQKEIDMISHYEDQIHTLEKYFGFGDDDNKKESYWNRLDLDPEGNARK